jgi:hypothetical protein
MHAFRKTGKTVAFVMQSGYSFYLWKEHKSDCIRQRSVYPDTDHAKRQSFGNFGTGQQAITEIFFSPSHPHPHENAGPSSENIHHSCCTPHSQNSTRNNLLTDKVRG